MSGLTERGENRPAPTCRCLRRTGQENAQPPGCHPLQLCRPSLCDAGILGFKGLDPFVPKGRREEQPVGMLWALPCCSGSQRGRLHLGLFSPLSPCWWSSGVVAKVASSGDPGMEPEPGAMPGDTFRDTKDNRILHCVGGSFSSLLLGHFWLVWGCFSAQLNLYLGLGWKTVVSPCSSLSLASGRARPGSDACLLCGLGQVTFPGWASGASFVELEVVAPAAAPSAHFLAKHPAGSLSYTSSGSGLQCGTAVRGRTQSPPAWVHSCLCHLSAV